MCRVTFLLILSAFMAGCSSSAFRTEVETTGLAPKSSEDKCMVYGTVVPDCRYFVVARVYVSSTSPKTDAEYKAAFTDLVGYAVSEAKRLGGDGVIELFTSTEGNKFLNGAGEFVGASIISFEDPNCDRNTIGALERPFVIE